MRRLGIIFILILAILAILLYFYVPPARVFAIPLAQNNDPVLVGAGDIASCNRTTDEATANLLDNIPGTIFTLGDNVYDDGSLTEYNTCYASGWGRHKARTKPVVGNHEYHTPGAEGHYTYWGDAASPTEPGCRLNCKGYYSYNLGAWHIIVLNSEIPVSASSLQNQWLRADLAANPSVCTLAIWHKPHFSSGNHGNWAGAKSLWDVLYANGVDVVLNGHDHSYERFAPQDPNANADPARGIREFVVGTGGKSLQPFVNVKPNSQVRNATTFGVLKFTLHSESYNWEFVPIAGQSFSDSGSAVCVGASVNPTPTPINPPTNTPTPINTPTNTPTNGPPSALDMLYVSSSSGGTVGSVTFADEDILAYHLPTGTWSKIFDGSRFALDAVDVDGFDFLSDGSLIMSFDLNVTPPGMGEVTIHDIVRFVPNQAGHYSSGVFSLFLDGSDVGLASSSETIDAITIAPDGRLIISTLGDLSANGLLLNDEDLAVFTGTTGENSAGTWSQYFDGSDLGMNNSTEDVWGAWADTTGDLYLSTLDLFYLQGIIEGDRNDIFICDPGVIGSRTACSLRIFWNGNDHGFGAEQLDDFALANSQQLRAASLENDAQDLSTDDSMNADIDDDREDGNELGSDDHAEVVYLPFMSK